MRANAISRLRTQPDLLRMFMQVKGSPFDSVRLLQTPGTALDFPDTEEVTGSMPVRPTVFFEILSRFRSWEGASHLRIWHPWQLRGAFNLDTGRCPVPRRAAAVGINLDDLTGPCGRLAARG